jgi:CRP/FNR family transcriptional regulator
LQDFNIAYIRNIETLSRLISGFQQQGILSAHGHEYCRLLNPTKLAAIAEIKT